MSAERPHLAPIFTRVLPLRSVEVDFDPARRGGVQRNTAEVDEEVVHRWHAAHDLLDSAADLLAEHVSLERHELGFFLGGVHGGGKAEEHTRLTPCPIPSARLDQCHQFSPITLKPAPFDAQTSITYQRPCSLGLERPGR